MLSAPLGATELYGHVDAKGGRLTSFPTIVHLNQAEIRGEEDTRLLLVKACVLFAHLSLYQQDGNFHMNFFGGHEPLQIDKASSSGCSFHRGNREI